MTEPVVLVEQRDHTLLVTINRPRAANSINAEVHQGLGEAGRDLGDTRAHDLALALRRRVVDV